MQALGGFGRSRDGWVSLPPSAPSNIAGDRIGNDAECIGPSGATAPRKNRIARWRATRAIVIRTFPAVRAIERRGRRGSAPR